MLSLNGTWKLKDFDPGQGLAQGAQRPETDTTSWIDVAVPGDVHRALVAAGRLAEPFDAQNIEACEWVERREWWYRTEFTPPYLAAGERIVAEFDGLDTFGRGKHTRGLLQPHGRGHRAAGVLSFLVGLLYASGVGP